MSVSVVLCTYNGARYLHEQLDSVLTQTRLPDQIVLRDDASSDDTWVMLTAWRDTAAARGIRVSLKRNQHNAGYVGNFEAALADASGQIVFLCDQDDVWHRDKIAVMLAEFERRPRLLLLHSDARLVDARGADMHCSVFKALEVSPEELALIHMGRAFDVLLRRNLVTGATTAMRRSLLEHAAPFPRKMVHDEWLALVAAATGEMDCLERALIDYRQHDANQIGARRRDARQRWGDLWVSRAEALRREIARMQELRGRVLGLPRSSHVTPLARLDDKLAHFEERLRIGGMPRWKRARAILHEAKTHRYAKWSNGRRSMLRDALRSD